MLNFSKRWCSTVALCVIAVSLICLLYLSWHQSSILQQRLGELGAASPSSVPPPSTFVTVIEKETRIENYSTPAIVTLDWTWPAIRAKEAKAFSQYGEDGVILFLLEQVGALSTGSKYFVEFGVMDGSECNTRNLRERYGWTGLMMDGSNENEAINLRKEFITSKNILQLFEKYQVPADLALLSIDLDYDDYWIMKAIDFTYYRPILLIIEYNCAIPVSENRVVDPMDTLRWVWPDGFTGAGIAAVAAVAERKGYKIVYATSQGVNLFLVRKDFFEKNNIMTTSLERIAAYVSKGCVYENNPKYSPDRKWFWNDLQS